MRRPIEWLWESLFTAPVQNRFAAGFDHLLAVEAVRWSRDKSRLVNRQDFPATLCQGGLCEFGGAEPGTGETVYLDVDKSGARITLTRALWPEAVNFKALKRAIG